MSCTLTSISSFNKDTLRPTKTVETSVLSFFNQRPDMLVEESERAPAGFASIMPDDRLTASSAECHGRTYGFEEERAKWEPPKLTMLSVGEARPGYNSMSASEYLDTDLVLRAKVNWLATLIERAKRPIYYCGAGLSTSAGIPDYASSKGSSVTARPQPSLEESLQQALANKAASKTSYKSPLCAQPALSHRVLVGLHRAGHMHRLVQQNHDGLPQKAGLPQHVMNEIHGACHSPDNPVVPMSGALRSDLFEDLLDCERSSDLTIAIGTSLCGMNADRVVSSVAARAAKGRALGAVVIGLQRTVLDADATLRIFAPIDTVFSLLAERMSLDVPPAQPDGEYFCPPVLRAPGGLLPDPSDDSRYLLRGLAYDATGRRVARPTAADLVNSSCGCLKASEISTSDQSIDLDLRDGARVAIPTGMHAGATGEVDGTDREGNPRCRFQLRLKKGGNVRAPFAMLLGTWHLQAAADGSVEQLSVVNIPADDDMSPAAVSIRSLCNEYSAGGARADAAVPCPID